MFPNKKDEYELITSWKNGNEKAFDQLFKLHFYKLHQFAFRHTNDSELSEELVMDVMLKVWQKKEKIKDDKTSLSSFLMHILKAALIDNYRKKRIEFIKIERIAQEPESAAKADDRLLANELNMIYQHSLTYLSPQKRLVMEMRQEQNMSYKEIAGKLNISTKTVDCHLCESFSVIRKHLRKHIDMTLLICCYLIG